MLFCRGGARAGLPLLVGCLWIAGGCSFIGPMAIATGRPAYNRVINTTQDQQILELIVRQRYDETFSLLSVASVTANVQFRTDLGAQVGIGSSKGYEGNLVPLAGGVAYEDNPTITYVPQSGEQFMRSMLTPITMEEGALLLEAARDKAVWLRKLLLSAEGLENRVVGEKDPRFERFADLYARLLDIRAVDIRGIPQARPGELQYALVLHDYEPEEASDVSEFLSLLGVDGETVDGRDIVLPLREAPGRGTGREVHFETRTVLDVVRDAGRAVALPPSHVAAGIVEVREQPAEGFIRIHSSDGFPENATVAIEHRGWWFYIDARDTASKQSFAILRLLTGIRLDQSPERQHLPVITVPVGG